jgi:acetyl esterase
MMAPTDNVLVQKPKSRLKKFLITTSVVLVTLALSLFIAFKVSPWPSALLIRYVFDSAGVKTNAALEVFVPKDVLAIRNEHYDHNDADAYLDVYFPSSIKETAQNLPTIVWIHGGGWIAGSKDQVANYCRILAHHGYVVVAIDYSIAPGKNYPVPLHQTNKALAYLAKHAERLHIDTSCFVLAGDSGGAHIAAQMTNVVVSPTYADQLKIKPAIKKEQLAGTILYCGPYDSRNVNLEGSSANFLKTVLWSYSGSKDFLTNPKFATASVIDYVDGNFPPTFISVGNDDPLAIHSHQLAKKLSSLNVRIDSLFFPANYLPALPHEYQFDLSTDASQLAMERSLKFLQGLKLKTS